MSTRDQSTDDAPATPPASGASACSAVVGCVAILQSLASRLPNMALTVLGVSRPLEEWLNLADAEMAKGDPVLRGKRMESLLAEVMSWHSDPQSPDYNECDTSPCNWCEQSLCLAVRSPQQLGDDSSGRAFFPQNRKVTMEAHKVLNLIRLATPRDLRDAP